MKGQVKLRFKMGVNKTAGKVSEEMREVMRNNTCAMREVTPSPKYLSVETGVDPGQPDGLKEWVPARGGDESHSYVPHIPNGNDNAC